MKFLNILGANLAREDDMDHAVGCDCFDPLLGPDWRCQPADREEVSILA